HNTYLKLKNITLFKLLISTIFGEAYNWIGKDYQELAFLIDKELRGNKDYYTIIDQILLNREVYTNEVLVSSSGKVLERSFIPIVINNAYCGFLWQFNDITEKSSFQDKIIRSEEKYRGIMDNMELGLLEVDNKHTIIRAYDRFCKMVGYTEEELLGKNAVDTFLNRSYHQVIEQHQTLRIGGKGSTYELPLIKKDGSIVWTLVSGSPILNVEGAVIGSIGIHYDLTERKKVEKDLNEAKTLAENARQAEKQFLANMSHEIRTPLNAIIGMVHLLLDTEPNSKQKEYLDSLNSSASFLHNLISNLLDLAKIDAGKIDIRKVEFNLETLLSDIVKIFELKSIKKDLKFSLKLTSINSKIFFGDEILIKQIFLNLIGNAEKFTENGEIKIGAEKVFSDSENRKTGINFYVEDTGKGISTNELESIFYKYKQADNQDLYNKGTGLGLAITKELIELLGGKIKVKSTLDEGTRFEFYLPLEEYSITSKVQKEDIPILHNPTLINILVAEDNLMNQKYISTLLNKWGFKCTIVENGEMVKSAICNEVYNLIFMDLQMPIVNGYDATLFIRQSNTENATIPVVALTASVLLEQKKLAFESGVTDFLAKPFTPKQLSEIIMKYV
ncbi:PAS domain S-box protein, partial [Emticicia sp. ODNR4P]|nr:PAS domain S-box protein [Emticicia sp. ODNR4P]